MNLILANPGGHEREGEVEKVSLHSAQQWSVHTYRVADKRTGERPDRQIILALVSNAILDFEMKIHEWVDQDQEIQSVRGERWHWLLPDSMV